MAQRQLPNVEVRPYTPPPNFLPTTEMLLTIERKSKRQRIDRLKYKALGPLNLSSTITTCEDGENGKENEEATLKSPPLDLQMPQFHPQIEQKMLFHEFVDKFYPIRANADKLVQDGLKFIEETRKELLSEIADAQAIVDEAKKKQKATAKQQEKLMKFNCNTRGELLRTVPADFRLFKLPVRLQPIPFPKFELRRSKSTSSLDLDSSSTTSIRSAASELALQEKDSYDISDYEEFVEDQGHRANKIVPQWAQGQNLIHEVYMCGPPYMKFLQQTAGLHKDPIFPGRPTTKAFPEKDVAHVVN